jgi:ADP-heptose:LPS heptosyltransferase
MSNTSTGGAGPAVGPLGPPLDGVRRIAVLRGGNIGDLLFALPAVDALKARYPDAHITLLCRPPHAALLADRPSSVDETVVLPIAEGVRGEPGQEPDEESVERFLADMQARSFDLAVQIHGGGKFSNPFLRRLGATTAIGLRTPDAEELDRTVPYRYYQHEVLRALEVVGLVDAPIVALEPQVAVTGQDRRRAIELLGSGEGEMLAIHPGATDPRRRWPAERFGEIAARAVAEGVRVVVVGDAGDSELAARVVEAAETAGAPAGSVVSLAGAGDLGQLIGTLAQATVLVGNDSGPRHIAQAVGCATVGIYWVGNVINAGPLGRSRHSVHLGWTVNCPECGIDVTQVGWTAERCEHNPSFVADVPVEAVWEDVRSFL